MCSSDDIVNFDATISHARLKLHFVFAVKFKFSLTIHYSQSKIFFDCKNTLDIFKSSQKPEPQNMRPGRHSCCEILRGNFVYKAKYERRCIFDDL